MKKSALPRSVYVKSGRYYLVRADGPKRVWIALSRVADGLPALHLALARVLRPLDDDHSMPAIAARWQRDVMPRHAPKTQRDERAMCAMIAASFAEFAAEQITPPAVSEYLSQYRDRPRSHNAHRGMLRELMRYAEEVGARSPGTNPVASIRTMPTPGRDRYITDSELRRIKVAAMRASDGHGGIADTRSGPMLCALIEVAYLTAQRIGDLLALEWSSIGPDGIAFQPSKTRRSTGARVFIEWTPRLRAAIERLRALRLERRGFGGRVFLTQTGQPYTYWGASTAWRRAVKRAGIEGVTFHDLRARALTDKERLEGMQAARVMGSHSTEQQTAGYVRNRSAARTKATK